MSKLPGMRIIPMSLQTSRRPSTSGRHSTAFVCLTCSTQYTIPFDVRHLEKPRRVLSGVFGPACFQIFECSTSTRSVSIVPLIGGYHSLQASGISDSMQQYTWNIINTRSRREPSLEQCNLSVVAVVMLAVGDCTSVPAGQRMHVLDHVVAA